MGYGYTGGYGGYWGGGGPAEFIAGQNARRDDQMRELFNMFLHGQELQEQRATRQQQLGIEEQRAQDYGKLVESASGYREAREAALAEADKFKQAQQSTISIDGLVSLAQDEHMPQPYINSLYGITGNPVAMAKHYDDLMKLRTARMTQAAITGRTPGEDEAVLAGKTIADEIANNRKAKESVQADLNSGKVQKQNRADAISQIAAYDDRIGQGNKLLPMIQSYAGKSGLPPNIRQAYQGFLTPTPAPQQPQTITDLMRLPAGIGQFLGGVGAGPQSSSGDSNAQQQEMPGVVGVMPRAAAVAKGGVIKTNPDNNNSYTKINNQIYRILD